MKILFFALSLVVAVASLDAQRASRPLPSFTVYDSGGAPAPSATLAATGRVVVIYLKPDCRPCDQLLGGLARLGEPALTSRLVFVIGGSVADGSAFATRTLSSGFATATWFADADGAAWAALELKGSPVMMGVEGERIEWTLRGAADRSLLESLVRTWLTQPGRAQ